MKNLWYPNEPNGGNIQECAIFLATRGNYDDDTCSAKFCFIRVWKDFPLFTLRGKVNQKFVLLPQESAGGNVFFFSLGETNMVFNKDAESWLIVKESMGELTKPGYQPSEIVAKFQPDKSSTRILPVGTNSWHLTDESNKVVPLKLTHVGVIINTY